MYATSYARKMLCALCFSKRIPDPVHVNASTNRQCTRRYRETMHPISRLKRRGFTVITQDESFFVNDVIRGYKLWAPVGKPIHVPYAGSHKKVVGHGAIADDRTQTFRIYEKFDTATFSRHLNELRRKYGRIPVLADDAAPLQGDNGLSGQVPRDGGPAQVPDGRPAHERRRGDVAQIQAGHPGV
jgi:hypothetical protein